MLGTGEELDLNYSQSGKKKKTNAHELQQTADLSRDDGVRGSQWEITAPLPAAPDVPAMTQEPRGLGPAAEPDDPHKCDILWKAFALAEKFKQYFLLNIFSLISSMHHKSNILICFIPLCFISLLYSDAAGGYPCQSHSFLYNLV